MSGAAIFQGGPADGYELYLIGGTPSFVMLLPSPVEDSMPWLIVGAGFDDHWPGSHRYELLAKSPTTATYIYSSPVVA